MNKPEHTIYEFISNTELSEILKKYYLHVDNISFNDGSTNNIKNYIKSLLTTVYYKGLLDGRYMRQIEEPLLDKQKEETLKNSEL